MKGERHNIVTRPGDWEEWEDGAWSLRISVSALVRTAVREYLRKAMDERQGGGVEPKASGSARMRSELGTKRVPRHDPIGGSGAGNYRAVERGAGQDNRSPLPQAPQDEAQVRDPAPREQDAARGDEAARSDSMIDDPCGNPSCKKNATREHWPFCSKECGR